MRYYAEIETRRSDGKIVIKRIQVDSVSEAVTLAFTWAGKMFGEEYVSNINGWWVDSSSWFFNDFGEPVSIRGNMYGEKSQVEPGLFVF